MAAPRAPNISSAEFTAILKEVFTEQRINDMFQSEHDIWHKLSKN